MIYNLVERNLNNKIFLNNTMMFTLKFLHEFFFNLFHFNSFFFCILHVIHVKVGKYIMNFKKPFAYPSEIFSFGQKKNKKNDQKF